MKIDEKTILYLEDLSFLTLSPEERARIAADLETILEGMATLSKLDTKSVTHAALSGGSADALRKDEAVISPLAEKLLANAPERSGEYFLAPQTLE
ncbi:MAG: Asp-tRNA(Asn)/Glu-tRNA(Gln) amidotransferase subunit GatC [Christensenellales bacterium]|jgi:aspartyl-tRNA(Asn)/glutamyl-tRNA(Gln) amidotransferase subunit C